MTARNRERRQRGVGELSAPCELLREWQYVAIIPTVRQDKPRGALCFYAYVHNVSIVLKAPMLSVSKAQRCLGGHVGYRQYGSFAFMDNQSTPQSFSQDVIEGAKYSSVLSSVLGFKYIPDENSFAPNVLGPCGLILTYAEFKELLGYIARFYELHDDDEIQAINNGIINRKRPRPVWENKVPNSQPGYVYLIRSSNGIYKIGHAKNPKDRMKTFGVQLPFEVEFEHLIPTDDMRRAEQLLHERYASKRGNGEWFALTDQDVADIKAIERL